MATRDLVRPAERERKERFVIEGEKALAAWMADGPAPGMSAPTWM